MRSRNLTAGIALAAAVSLVAAAAPAVAASTIGEPSTRAAGLASPLGPDMILPKILIVRSHDWLVV